MVYIVEHFDFYDPSKKDSSKEDHWISNFAFTKLEDAQNYLQQMCGLTATNKMKYENAYHTAIISKLFLYGDFKED